MPKKDREDVKQQMRRIRAETCISFREMPNGRHHKHKHILKIKSVNPNERCSEGSVATIGKARQQEVLLELTGSGCGSGLILHELFHVLGMAHTQKRPDRDNYIDIAEDCIKGKTEEETLLKRHQYKKLKKFDTKYYNIPYMCNSIMHYTIYQPHCPEMIPKRSLYCKYGWVGSLNYPLPEDWEMIRRALLHT